MTRERKKILIVDDDVDFVEALASFIEAHGYVVVRAHTGTEGVRKARLEEPDLIVMDVMMTERTEGFFAVQQIRRTPEIADTPIFVCSSIYANPSTFEIRPGAEWMAHDEFFQKPADLGALLSRIREKVGPADVVGEEG